MRISALPSVSKIGTLPGFRVQLRHVEPRLARVGACARGAIGPELEDDVFLRLVTWPDRQARTVRVAVLGEVDPVALRHPGDRQILGRKRVAPPRRPASRRHKRFRRRAGRRLATSPEASFGRRRNDRGRRANRWQRTQSRRSARARPDRSRHWLATPGWRARSIHQDRRPPSPGSLHLPNRAKNSSLVAALIRLPAVSALLLPSSSGTRGCRRAW